MADDADGTDQAVLLRRDVELTEQRSAGRVRDSPLRVDAHLVHPPEVDDDAAVGRGVPERAVPAATDRDLEVALPAEANCRLDVRDAQWADHERRSTIEHRVPDPARVVVPARAGRDDVARETAA